MVRITALLAFDHVGAKVCSGPYGGYEGEGHLSVSCLRGICQQQDEVGWAIQFFLQT